MSTQRSVQAWRRALLFSAPVLLLGALLGVMWNTSPSSRPGAAGKEPEISKAAAFAEPAAELSRPEPRVRGPIEAFAAWPEAFAATPLAERERRIQEGIALARERRPLFKELIRTDPESALRRAVPVAVRQRLPPAIRELLEQRINEVGALRVMHADPLPGEPSPSGSLSWHEAELESGKTYRARVYGRRAGKATWTPGASLNGVALDSDFAVSDEPFRMLEAGEVPHPDKPVVCACPVCGGATRGAALRQGEALSPGMTAVETATEVVFLCEPQHLEPYKETLLLGEGVSGGAFGFTGILPAAPTPALGIVKVLAIPMTYADQNAVPSTEAALYSTLRDVADFYAKSSFGRLTLVGAVSPPVKLSHNEAWYVNRDTTNGGDISGTSVEHSEARDVARKLGFDSNDYDCIIVRHNGGPGSYGGLGGGSSVWARSDAPSLWAHEVGHCFGLAHSNFWDTAGTSSIGAGTNQEYGDVFDNMGNSGSYPAGQYNTQAKYQIKWLPSNFIESVTQSGQYRVYAFDQSVLLPSRRYAMTIVKDAQKTYWGEVRSLFDSNPWAKNGLFLGWRYPNGGTSNLHRIDTTPGSPFVKDDAPISLGSTFSDMEAGIHLTTVAMSESPRYADVVVNFGQFPGNRKPTLALAASASTVPTGATVTFTATASDPDGDSLAYAWQHFGDTNVKLVSGNSAVITRTFGTSGTYVVTCTVSDMKGGSVTRNQLITVGSGNSRSTIRGRVTFQGQGLQDVVITANGSNGVVTDADGYYTIPNLTANTYTMTPLLYGYTFGELFNNSVTVGPSASGADFEASATPVVTLAASTPLAAELAPVTAGRFTLTRTGDLSLPLVVNVNSAQGSATKGSDYAFSPDYAAGSQGFSSFTIPADAASLEVAVTPVVDSAQEGPETVTLQLGPGNGYLVGASSAATVVIDDDDTSLPKVSLAASISSTTEGSGAPASFTLSRTGSTSGTLTVNYSVSGSAASGADFSPLSGAAEFPAGAATVVVNVALVNDSVSESLETAILTLTGNAAYLVDPLASSATAYLIDDDVQTVTVSASDPSAQEVDLSAPGAVADTGTFLITRSGDISSALTVYYAMTGTYNAGVAALHGVDYEALPGSVVIPAGAAQAAVTILPRYDTLGEGPEAVVFSLGAGSTNYILGAAISATVTIADGASDLPYVDVVNTASAAEPSTNGNFRLTLRGGSGTGTVTVRYSIAGTASAGSDYNISGLDNGTLTGTASITLNNGATVIKDISVVPVNDSDAEDLENVVLSITPDAAYQTFAATSAASMWVRDNELPTVYVDTQVGTSGSLTFTEGATTTPVKFYVSRTGSTTGALTVNYTVGGTATAGADYNALGGSVTIPAGALGADVAVTVINDTSFEGTETISFDFAPGSYATGPGTVMYIADNESSSQLVGFNTTSSSALESAGSVSIPVTLTTAAIAPVTVEYLVDGSASTSSSSGVSTTNATLPYWIRATKSGTSLSSWMSLDGVNWFQMHSTTISNLSGTSPLVGIVAGSGTVGQSCTAVFDNVSVTNLATGGSVGAEAHSTVGTTNPSSTSSNASGVYTLTAGSSGIVSGSTSDNFRAVFFPLSSSSSCSITARVVSLSGGGTSSRAGVMIRDSLAVNSVHYSFLAGGDIRTSYAYRTTAGSTNTLITLTPIAKPYWLRVERSGDILRSYVSANGSSFTIVGGNQTIALGPDVLAGLIVSARQDGLISSATFDNVTISPAPPGGVAFARRSVGFVNESGAYAESAGVHTLSGSGAAIGSSASDEGDLAGMVLTGNFVLTARVTSQTGGANNAQAGLTIRENGSKDARMIYVGTTTNFGLDIMARTRTRTTAFGSGVDFDLAPGVLSFGVGEQTKNILVSLTNDNILEPDETVSITVRNPNGAQLRSTSIYNLTIVDDETASSDAVAAFASAASTAPEAGGTIELPVSLSQPAAGSGSVAYAVTGGSAVDPADYTLAAGTLSFAAGETVQAIPLSLVQDEEVESAETVEVTLSNPTGLQLGNLTSHTLTLTDDDFPTVTIAATDASAAEGGDPGTFTITRAGSFAGDLTVNYTRSGTATSGTDYTAIASPGTVTIPGGQASASVTVSPVQDTNNEGNETVILTLAVGDGYTLGTSSSATVTIADDDRSTVTILASDASASETAGNPGHFTITRTAPFTSSLAVSFIISGTATTTSDYSFISSPATIPAGQSSVTVTITPVNDSATEGPEDVTLSLSSGSYFIGADSFASVSIEDNDNAPTLFITSPSAQGPLVAYGNGVIVQASVADDGAPSPVSLQWSAVSGPGTVSIESPTSAATAVTFDASGTYVLRITATDGQFTVSDQVTVVVGSGITAADWITQDLGPSSARRGQGLPFGGLFSVSGTGAGYSSTSDQAHVMIRSVDGDCAIVARLTSIQGTGSPLAGLTLRDSMMRGARRAVLGYVTGTGLQFRTRATVSTTDTVTTLGGVSLPVWLRLERNAATNAITASYAPDASGSPGAWTTVGVATVLAMDARALAGLTATSNSTSSTATALFDQVSLTPEPAGPALLSEDYGTAPAAAGSGGESGGTHTMAGSSSGYYHGWQFYGDLMITVKHASSTSGAGSAISGLRLAENIESGAYAHAGRIPQSAYNGYLWRSIAGGGVSGVPSFSGSVRWIRMVRRGNSITAYHAADASGSPGTWAQLGQPQTVIMTTPVFAGFWVDNNSGVGLNTVTFTNLDIQPLNRAPVVSVASLASGTLSPAPLDGTVADDSYPAPVSLSTTWTRASGPGPVTFGDASQADTTASFTESGSYRLRLQADDGSAVTFADLVFTGASGAFDVWRLTNFPSGFSGPEAGPLQDPDGDGLPNLLEYATGNNPMSTSSSGTVSDFVTSGPDSFLRLEVTKNPAATDVTFEVQATSDLSNEASWSSSGLVIEEDSANRLRVRDSVPVTSTSRRFLRVRVTR